MKDHTDRAAIRLVIAMVGLALFVVIIWGPLNTIWVGPWIFEGTTIGSLAWRKAWVINGWIIFAPVLITFTYCFVTMARAIRQDAIERQGSQSK